MKILVGGIYHESHSFSNVPTDLEAFRKVLLIEGLEVVEQLRGTTSEMAGFILGAERFGFELVPTLWAWTVSTGPVQAATLEYMLGVVSQTLRHEGTVDGILFTLHGALVAEQALDGDGYILSRLRSFVGKDVPIVVTVDLHANISDQMVEVADAIVGYDTYPHVDQVERGLEAAELLVRTIRGEIKPVMALEKPPMITIPHKQLTDAHPMKELLAMAHKAEGKVLSVTVSGGFAYSDVPEIGPGVIVVSDNEPELARRLAKEIAGRMWELRAEFAPQLPAVREAIKRAIESKNWPVILADVGDNIGAGTPGDSTFVLRELLEQGAVGAVVIIADPEAVSEAIAAGKGQMVHLSVGGKCDALHGKPVHVEGRVMLTSDGVFRNRGQMRDGIVENMGRTVVVATSGVKLVLTEIKMPPWNLEQLRSVGISPEQEQIIALKSAVAFRAAYEPIAGEIIEVNSPGLSTVDLKQFDYKHIRRPLYPLDLM
ncbi:MAG: M81 family metallopeptidase [Acidobacteriota bacterium]|nr:M81 family metallopeptidase [Acidobacteriota bacterium]